MTQDDNATVLLGRWHDGDDSALEALLPIVYQELRRLAKAQLSRSNNPHIQCTELISEAYLKLINIEQIDWQNRNHFFSVAAKTMRRVLVDQYRQQHAQKRGSGTVILTFYDDQIAENSNSIELDKLDDAITELERLDPRQAEVVTLKFFGGLKIDEIAELMGLSVRTIKREWAMARLWLHKEIVND